MRRNSKAYKELEAIREAEALKPRMSTSYSSPKKSFFAGMNDLRQALAYGDRNCRLEKRWNQDCDHPIVDRYSKNDFKDFKFWMGVIRSVDEIKADTQMDEFEKHLTLNYRACYGTPEAVQNYYEHGILTEDNLLSGGRSHLVKITDLIKFYQERVSKNVSGTVDQRLQDVERVKNYTEFYITGETSHEKHWVDLFTLKDDVKRFTPRIFKRKLWVVVTYHNYDEKFKTPVLAKVLNALAAPLKYIPRKSVLKMDEYTIYSWRVGGVRNGYEIEFQIPKKFSFKN